MSIGLAHALDGLALLATHWYVPVGMAATLLLCWAWGRPEPVRAEAVE